MDTSLESRAEFQRNTGKFAIIETIVLGGATIVAAATGEAYYAGAFGAAAGISGYFAYDQLRNSVETQQQIRLGEQVSEIIAPLLDDWLEQIEREQNRPYDWAQDESLMKFWET